MKKYLFLMSFLLVANSLFAQQTWNLQDINLEMIECPAGKFVMGEHNPDPQKRPEPKNEYLHEVKFTKPFYIGKYEVTQSQYKAVMGENSFNFEGETNPADSVAWTQAIEFCDKLNEKYASKLPTGYKFDLPTEAQWEYACRAGTTTDFNNGKNINKEIKRGKIDENIDEVAWYKNNSEKKTHPVGQKKPNAWGIYDMHGNVGEWCKDYYSEYPRFPVVDFERESETGSRGDTRTFRGGGYDTDSGLKSSSRWQFESRLKGQYFGFRVALVPIDENKHNSPLKENNISYYKNYYPVEICKVGEGLQDITQKIDSSKIAKADITLLGVYLDQKTNSVYGAERRCGYFKYLCKDLSLTPEQSINLKFDISETTNVNEVTKFIYDRLNFDFNFSANIKLSAPEKDRPYRYQFISCKFSDASLKYKSNLFTYNYSGEKPTKTEITFDEAVTGTITTSDGDYKKGFEPICSSYSIGKNYTDLPLCLKPYAQNLVQINFKTLNDESNLSLNGFKLLNGKENKQDSVRSDLKFTVYGVLNSITYVDGNTVTFNDKPVNESEWLGLEKKIAILVPQKEEQVAWEGTGTIENPFLIKNSSDLLALKNSTKFMEGDYYFKQVEDISGLDNWGELKDRNFLYNYDLTFKGHYDGNGKTINGLNIKAEKKATLTIPEQENNYQALFRKCENAEISNLTINCNIDAVENSMVGALVGEAKASKFTNIVVNGSFKGADCIGGLVGSGTELVFKDIKVNANINGQNNAGGVLAFGDKVIAENISATSNIKGSDYVGGVFGCLKSNNSLTNITCSAEIEGASFCGGIVGSIGENSNGEKLQVSGKVSGMNAVGGIIGEAFGNRPNINKNTTTIEEKPDTYSNLVSSAEVKASDENFRYGYGAAGGVICNAYDNISITNAINNGSVCGLQTVGGVIAHAKLNKIHTTDLHCITLSKCTNHGNITNINPKSASSCGGVFGDVNNANINDCYNDGNLSGEKCGGILCRVFKSSINNCYSIGTLSSSSYRSEDLGALVVNMQKSSIANCFTTGDTKYINTSKNNKFHAIGIYDTDYKRYDNKDENIEVFGSAADIKLNETWKQDAWEIKSGEYPKLK